MGHDGSISMTSHLFYREKHFGVDRRGHDKKGITCGLVEGWDACPFQVWKTARISTFDRGGLWENTGDNVDLTAENSNWPTRKHVSLGSPVCALGTSDRHGICNCLAELEMGFAWVSHVYIYICIYIYIHTDTLQRSHPKVSCLPWRNFLFFHFFHLLLPLW